MHQVFPTPASAQRAPKSVQRAVWLMFSGAVVYLVSGIVGLVLLVTGAPGSPADTRLPSGPQWPGPVIALGSVLLYLIAALSIVAPIAVWLWMAWKCRAGRAWARDLSTVCFGLATIVTLTSGPYSTWGLVGAIVGWLLGLGAIILLWQRSSSSYFRATARYQG